MWCMSPLMSCWFVPQRMRPGTAPAMASSCWWPLQRGLFSWCSLSQWAYSCATGPKAGRPPRDPCKKIQDLFAFLFSKQSHSTFFSSPLKTIFHIWEFCLNSPWCWPSYFDSFGLSSHLLQSDFILQYGYCHNISFDRTKRCGRVYSQETSMHVHTGVCVLLCLLKCLI